MSNTPTHYSPSCAQTLYKPHLADKLRPYLTTTQGEPLPLYETCCQHKPPTPTSTSKNASANSLLQPSQAPIQPPNPDANSIAPLLQFPDQLSIINSQFSIITTCPGCDRNINARYRNAESITLWEILANSTTFPFPNYNGMQMTIHDSCPTRHKAEVTDAIRILLQRMNIKVIEPEQTKEHGICCGDSQYGKVPTGEVMEYMQTRADQMPCENVVVYCVSCIKAMHIGGKKPRYLVDLLLSEETIPGDCDLETWHQQLDEFIAKH